MIKEHAFITPHKKMIKVPSQQSARLQPPLLGLQAAQAATRPPEESPEHETASETSRASGVSKNSNDEPKYTRRRRKAFGNEVKEDREVCKYDIKI